MTEQLFETRSVESEVARPRLEQPAPETSGRAEVAAMTRDDQRRQDIALAAGVLRGQDIATQEMFALAKRLAGVNEFGAARKLYGRIRKNNHWSELDVTAACVGQRHALATYKDPDLPASERFQRALDILDEIEVLDFSAPPGRLSEQASREFDPRRFALQQRQESLGLRGAVHKRRWQVEGQRPDLELALGFYLKGYELGVETDGGYTGINAAFVLDLIAREDVKQASKVCIEPTQALERLEQAREIRRQLVQELPKLPQRPGQEKLDDQWWFHATVAEAHVGLGAFEAAVSALRGFNVAKHLPHRGPPLEEVARWEFESTLTQLTNLALLQTDLARLLPLRRGDGTKFAPPLTAEQWNASAREALLEYLGPLKTGFLRAETGKVGLAMSGGGFRASLFHIGVLARLAEQDVLRDVEVLSCVSGGSVVGAHYYLELQHLLEQKVDDEIAQDDYLDIVERLQRDFLAGVQTNIRSQVFGGLWSNLRSFLQPGYTTTRRLGALYERELFARVKDGRGDKDRHLQDLLVNPKGEEPSFKPKYDNWRRKAKVPMLVLNATTLNTGHNWQFTASWMGEPPTALDAEIGGNYRLRRMYHAEAPRRSKRWESWYARPFAPPDYRRLRLGEAVAASSCVPGLFEPIVLPDLFPGKVVRLVDGGVHDNQGVASLLEQDCNVLLMSDASGQMEAQDRPSDGRLGVTSRSFSVSMSRVRQAQFRELAARERSGLLKGLMFLHLKKDLDADPVDWRDCDDPFDASDEARPVERRGVVTRYGIHKRVQRLLAGVRTDLDSFTDLEAYALMASGYRQAERQLERLPQWKDAPRSRRAWDFLPVEPLLAPGEAFEDVQFQLEVGNKSALKVWRLSLALRLLGTALLVAAALGALRLAWVYRDTSLVTVRGLAVALIVLAAGLVAPQLVALVRYRQTVRTFGLKSLLAFALALVFKLHLLVFDPLFLRLGKLARFLPQPTRKPS